MDSQTVVPGFVVPLGSMVVQLRKGKKSPLVTKGGSVIPINPADFVPLPGHNVGIYLNGMYLCVDIDRPSYPGLDAFKKNLPRTWEQKTPKGHHLLYRVPPGFKGTNKGQKTMGWGDIKCLGYIVAPGSKVDDNGPGHPAGSYAIFDARDPVAAPQWLLAMMLEAPPDPALGTERDSIICGTRDDSLVALAGAMRRQGYSEMAIGTMLQGIIDSGIVEQPVGDEISADVIERIAHSASKWSIGLDTSDIKIKPTDWVSESTVPEFKEVVQWILPGFVPAVGLTVIYGDGKIGKSSLASWIAALVCRMDRVVLFIPSGEETFQSFVQRARKSGTVDRRIYSWPSTTRFTLPKGVQALEAGCETLGNVGLVYIDALYSHFGDTPGLHAGERARQNLAALAEFAINNRLAVIGTIHENASGGLLGSREIRNIARSLIHATRKPGGDLILRVDGSNGFPCDYGIAFPGVPVPDVDSRGNRITFTDAFDEVHEQSTWVLSMGKKVSGKDSFDPDSLESPVNNNDRIREYFEQHPDATRRNAAVALGLSERTIQRWRGQSMP